MSGPQGVVTTNDGTQVWATDGDSTVKVIDLAAGKIVDTISTGGKQRTGELAYDPRDKVVLVTNPDETPQYVTLISTAPAIRSSQRSSLRMPPKDSNGRPIRRNRDCSMCRFPPSTRRERREDVAEIDPRSGKARRPASDRSLQSAQPCDHS